MPTSTAFEATYLTPGGGSYLGSPNRFAVAGALEALRQQLRVGQTASVAQAVVAASDRHDRAMAAAEVDAGLPAGTLSTAFRAIDSL